MTVAANKAVQLSHVDAPNTRLVEVVPDSIWDELSPTVRVDTETDKQLMDGKTLFIEGNVSNGYQRADNRGYKQKARKHIYKGKKGSYVKWERKQERR